MREKKEAKFERRKRKKRRDLEKALPMKDCWWSTQYPQHAPNWKWTAMSTWKLLLFCLFLSPISLTKSRVLGNNNIWSNRGNPINHLTAPSIGVLMKYYTARWLEFCDARTRRRKNYRLMNKFMLLSLEFQHIFPWNCTFENDVCWYWALNSSMMLKPLKFEFESVENSNFK